MDNTEDHTSLDSQVTIVCAYAKSLDYLVSAGFRSKMRAGSKCELHSRGLSASTLHAGGGKPQEGRCRLGFKQREAFTCRANVPTQLNNCPRCKLALLIFVDVMTGSLGALIQEYPSVARYSASSSQRSSQLCRLSHINPSTKWGSISKTRARALV